MAYAESLPASFNPSFTFGSNVDIKTPFKQVDLSHSQYFTPEALAKNASVTDAFASTIPGTQTAPAWTFITAPEDISWDVANQANRVDMFGTNNPPLVAGSRGMRDLTLGNALVEGFVRNVTIEGKVAALEDLLNYRLNQSDGFVSVPVYQVWANSKSYGGSNAYFIIKDVKVKEKMRDLKGNATRAYVDLSLMEVPAYQVNTGRDQASEVASSAKALALPDPKALRSQTQAATTTAAATAADKGLGAKSGPNTASPGKPSTGITPRPREQWFKPLPNQ